MDFKLLFTIPVKMLWAFFVFGLFLMSPALYAQEKQITGTITDQQGVPLPGVNILVKGTANGTQTDFDGNYAINAAPGQVLVFTYIGLKKEERTVGNANTLDLKMSEDAEALDEVVVIGYGAVKKSDLTGAVASVKERDLTSIPVTNALETMQGKVPGVDLTKSSGQAGAGLNFSIRGNRSLNADNGPLVVVDGMIYGSTLDVNPNDIASVEILKDARQRLFTVRWEQTG